MASIGSWPTVLPSGARQPWQLHMFLILGIILSMASVLCATKETIRLRRISASQETLPCIHRLLGSSDVQGRIKPRAIRVYTLQLPVIFLTGAAVCNALGMCMLAWSIVLDYVRGLLFGYECITGGIFKGLHIQIVCTIVGFLSGWFFFGRGEPRPMRSGEQSLSGFFLLERKYYFQVLLFFVSIGKDGFRRLKVWVDGKLLRQEPRPMRLGKQSLSGFFLLIRKYYFQVLRFFVLTGKDDLRRLKVWIDRKLLRRDG